MGMTVGEYLFGRGYEGLLDSTAYDSAWAAISEEVGLSPDTMKTIWEQSQPESQPEDQSEEPRYPDMETWEMFLQMYPGMPPNFKDWPDWATPRD
jgi:hypothetical protein